MACRVLLIAFVPAVALPSSKVSEINASARGASAAVQFVFLEKKLPSMGSVFELQIVTQDEAVARQELFPAVQQRLDALEAELSLYQPGSAINKLNREGAIEGVSNDFLNLIELSKTAYKESDGIFDITILPVLNLIEKSFGATGRPPSERYVDALRPLVDSRLVLFDRTKKKIWFTGKGVQITLDGIAKGYAVDRVADMLAARGIENYLLNFSGNMRWNGHRADNKMWKIQTWHPENKAMRNVAPSLKGCVATSGVEHRHYTEDERWHHLIDPRILRPAQSRKAYTAQGTLAVDCDIQSTVGFIRGK